MTTGRIIYGTTIPLSSRIFLSGQINLLAGRGEDVVLVYGTDEPGPITEVDPRVAQIPVKMSRDPDLKRDPGSLARMMWMIRKFRPSTVAFGTPKMSLLGLLAAFVCRVPRRVYILFGLRLEGASGLGLKFLAFLERVAMACSTEIVAISESNRERVLELGLTRPDKIVVLGQGGLGGLDLNRFRRHSPTETAAARERFGVPVTGPVIGFLGRLAPDKGIGDLASAWDQIHAQYPEATLLVIGSDESSKIGQGHLVSNLQHLDGVVMHGPVADPEAAFAAMDLLVLLTKREGFGQVLIEAAACGVPAVTTRVSGTVDAVVDGETALLVEWGDPDAAARAVMRYLDEDELLATHGTAAATRAAKSFSTDYLDRIWADHVGATS